MAKKTNCKKHPEKASVATCSRCFAAMCQDCKQMDGLHPICVDCKASSKSSSSARTGVILALVAVAGGVGYYAYASSGHTPPPAPAVTEADKAKDFSNLDDLGGNPCDQKKGYAMVDKLLQAGENKGVIEKVAAINAKCKPWAPFFQLTYKAHQNLGEMDKAEADLNELMKSEPDNITFHLWRGIFLEDAVKKPEKALDDYVQALLITPKIAGEMPGRLSSIYEKQGKICDALYPVRQQVAVGTDKGYEAKVRARITELEAKGDCEVSGSGEGEIKVDKDAKLPRAKLKLGEKETGVFGVDSNLAYVVVTNDLATKLGLDVAKGVDMIVKFNKEKKAGKVVRLPVVGIGKLETKDVPAVVLDKAGEGVDGVIGQSLLVRFDVRPEGEGMVLSMRAKSAAPAASGSAAAGEPKK